ncbi:MAG: glycosyltransferase [Pseudomonadota bacterium]
MSIRIAKIRKVANTLLHKLDRTVFPVERLVRGRVGSKSPATGARKLVLVTTDYPPIVSGGIYRTVGLVTAAKARGWEVEVVVPRVSHKGRSLDPYMADRGQIADRVHDIAPPQRDIKRGWIRDVHGGMDQAMATFRQISNLQEAAPDFVIASGPSFLSFVAAYWLAQYWRCRLVLDYRDEWTTHAHQLFLRTPVYEKEWERRCLGMADWITVTTVAQKSNLVDAFGLGRRADRFIVMPNGWDRADCMSPVPSVEQRPGTGIPQLGYFGSLRKTTFIPALFEALAETGSAGKGVPQLHIYGDIRVEEALLDAAIAAGNVVLHPNIPKSEVFGLMVRMDGLVASFADGLGDYLPGKLADYLASDRPVLFIGPDGEAAKLVRELGAGRHLQGSDSDEIKRVCAELLNDPAERYDTAARAAWRENNERHVLMERLLETCHLPLWRYSCG